MIPLPDLDTVLAMDLPEPDPAAAEAARVRQPT